MSASKEAVSAYFREDGKKYIVRLAKLVTRGEPSRGLTLEEARQEAIDRARENPGSVYCIFMAINIVEAPLPFVMFETVG